MRSCDFAVVAFMSGLVVNAVRLVMAFTVYLAKAL